MFLLSWSSVGSNPMRWQKPSREGAFERNWPFTRWKKTLVWTRRPYRWAKSDLCPLLGNVCILVTGTLPILQPHFWDREASAARSIAITPQRAKLLLYSPRTSCLAAVMLKSIAAAMIMNHRDVLHQCRSQETKQPIPMQQPVFYLCCRDLEFTNKVVHILYIHFWIASTHTHTHTPTQIHDG